MKSTIGSTTILLLALSCVNLRGAEVLTVMPGEVRLVGQRAHQRLLVSSIYADGRQADRTRDVTYTSLNPEVASVDQSGVVRPGADGTTHIVIRGADSQIAVPVVVLASDEVLPVDFRTETIAALSRGGCSQGACHGSPQGKNGFRLSLRGFDPNFDIQTLTREGIGRRLNHFTPDQSLLLKKGTGAIAHGGGVRLRKDELAYDLIRQWIAEGGRDDTDPLALERLEISPPAARLHESQPRQQLIAMAHFNDGSVRDVTDLAVFTVTNDAVVEVSPRGLVEFHNTAEAAVLVRYLDKIQTARISYVDLDPDFQFSGPAIANYIDRHVFAKQRDLQLRPARVTDDATYLRRVYLDLIGSIPTPNQARQFLDSAEPQKRRILVDELLGRKEYGLFWGLKWADIMRGNRETISQRGVHNFHRYLIRTFEADRPFDQVAREIITSVGNTIQVPAANFYRVSRNPTDTAESFSQLFLGVRIQCAKCHNHPYESITQRDYYGLAATFARVNLKGQRFGRDDEVVFLKGSGEVKMPGSDQAMLPFAFGTALESSAEGDDHREQLAVWLTSPRNRFFAKSTVNRVWHHLMGRGLVDPIDDFRDSNPPSNTELLDALADDFVQNGYRFKPLMRSILSSNAYQLAANLEEPQSSKAANAEPHFTHAVIRMLSAEQILDAISTATGIPESFPGYPLGTKAIELAEGGIDHKFLQAFTKPVRDVACDCARETEPSLNQVMHLMNNPSILRKIDSEDNRLARWIKEGKSTTELVDLLYLSTVSRYPTPDERQFVQRFLSAGEDTSERLCDLQHALVNSNEFLLRH